MKKKKSSLFELIALALMILVYAFSFGALITSSSGSVSIYAAVNWHGNHTDSGLISAYVLLSFVVLLIGTIVILDLCEVKFPISGYFEVFGALVLLAPGFLFSFGRYFALSQKSKAALSLDNMRYAHAGWGTIICAILCFLACVVLLYSGVKKIIEYHKQLNAYYDE